MIIPRSRTPTDDYPFQVANMYAALYGGQPTVQGIQLLQDLKLGQYIKIPPQVNFVVQILGCIVGAILNYVMMYGCLLDLLLREVELPTDGVVLFGFAFVGCPSSTHSVQLSSPLLGLVCGQVRTHRATTQMYVDETSHTMPVT